MGKTDAAAACTGATSEIAPGTTTTDKSCRAITTCQAGYGYSGSGATEACTACATGKFKAAAGKVACANHKTDAAAACTGVTPEIAPGTTTADKSCRAITTCAAGKGIKSGACANGKKETAAGTLSAARTCVTDTTVTVTKCPPGQAFTAISGSTPASCAWCPSNRFNANDDNSASCTQKITACVAGKKFKANGNIKDDECIDCTTGTYNAANDKSADCTAQATCTASEKTDVAGSTSVAKTCIPDPAKTVTTCPAGQQFAAAVAPAKPTCSHCADGKYSDADDALACKNQVTCATGKIVKVAGGKLKASTCVTKITDCDKGKGFTADAKNAANNKCDACAAGKFSAKKDSEKCKAHSTCNKKTHKEKTKRNC